MRYSALVFFILFSICNAWPVSEVPELAENWERRSLFPKIYNFPESLLPAGVSVLYIGGIVEDYDSLTIFLIGLRGEEPDILASGPQGSTTHGSGGETRRFPACLLYLVQSTRMLITS